MVKAIETENLYEPAGAFGNMLFERAPLWSEQNVAENTVSKPFIDVLTYMTRWWAERRRRVSFHFHQL